MSSNSNLAEFIKDFSLEHNISNELAEFILSSGWLDDIKSNFFSWLKNDVQTLERLNYIFQNQDALRFVVPIFIYSEKLEDFKVIFTDINSAPPEPGEKGSILAFLRVYGFDDDFISSDCYGQLSCSSCMVEIYGGKLLNNEPREEEYDMLDIDYQRKATKYSRLSCQSILTNYPVLITIRKKKKN